MGISGSPLKLSLTVRGSIARIFEESEGTQFIVRIAI
jgi:hypothetical protein